MYPTNIRNPSSLQWDLTANSRIFTSPFDNSTQRVSMPGSLWHCNLSYVDVPDPDAGIIKGFLTSQNGQINAFTFVDPVNPTSKGSFLPSDVITIQSVSGTTATILVTGSNAVGYLLPGDWISISGELKMVKTQVDMSSGVGVIQFSPAVRNPGISPTFVAHNPTGVFRLATDQVASWPVKQGNLHDFNIQLIEDLNV